MNVQVAKIDQREILGLISQSEGDKLSKQDKATFNNCLMLTTSLWVGRVDGKFVCTWGLIPPTLLSEQAYLWLYTSENLKPHEFLFIRRSQIEVQRMLEIYPSIHGHTKVEMTKAVRWLKWLGAEFSEAEDGIMSFVIRKKNG